MSHLSNTFSALGNATRFAIVERLLKEGELSSSLRKLERLTN